MITLDATVAKLLWDITATLDSFDYSVDSDEFSKAASLTIAGVMHRLSNNTVARLRPEGAKITIL